MNFDLILLDIIAIIFGLIWISVGVYKLVPVFIYLIQKNLFGKDVYIRAQDELDDEELPTIDVLLPAYCEEPVIQKTLDSIREADYPQELISIIVLLEPDDEETHKILEDIDPSSSFRYVDEPKKYMHRVVVPQDYPGESNKPRALNYGFEESYGDIVGVLDAEDIVDPKLFRKVAGALYSRDYDYVQGILDMQNEDDGWTNSLFRGEYGWWYRLHVPAYYDNEYPVALGGTTNFAKREVMEEISEIRKKRFGHRWDDNDDRFKKKSWLSNLSHKGLIPWDPINVTEDFELGHLLWLEDFNLGLIESVTEEESPITFSSWVNQRTRWEKGKIFTFLQYVKHDQNSLMKNFHVTMQSMLPHLGIINVSGLILFSLVAVVNDFRFDDFTLKILFIGLTLIIIEMSKQSYGYWIASDKPVKVKIPRAVVNFFTLPVYWLPFWLADLIAIKEIYTGDMNWKKTPHHGRHYKESETD
ncbi:MAG: glycosyltransferase [Halobacteria archaeon]